MTSDHSAKPNAARAALWRYALIGAMIAFAGPPIYIHTPKVYGELHGLDLALLGGVLVALRALDFVQDPLLGWLISRAHRYTPLLAGCFSLLFGAGMIGLFYPAPLDPMALWLGVSLLCVFTGFSGLQILFYSLGLNLADQLKTSHARIAAWRETAVLVGVSAACIAPVALALWVGEELAYGFYALVFGSLLAVTYLLSRPLWRAPQKSVQTGLSFKAILGLKNIWRLLLIGFVNSLPTGVTSTLFLFYVEDRLGTDFHAGPMLLVFFLSAAFAAPLWGSLASRYAVKPVLITGMCLAIPAFVLAAFLGQGDIIPFYLICVLSGAALGADMTLIPAILSDELTRQDQPPAMTFGLLGFITKMAFAVGAGIGLFLLARGGYTPGADNPESALRVLAFTYALVPCLLKFIAIAGVALIPLPKRPI